MNTNYTSYVNAGCSWVSTHVSEIFGRVSALSSKILATAKAIASIIASYFSNLTSNEQKVVKLEETGIEVSKLVYDQLGYCQQYIELFKELVSHSNVPTCSYKRIYIYPCQSSRPIVPFEEDGIYPVDLMKKFHPLLESEILLILMPIDQEKSRLVESHPVFHTCRKFDVDIKVLPYRDYTASIQRKYFTPEIIAKIFTK